MLLFCDSFDHYATTDLLEKYSSAANAAIVGGGRTGNALQLSYYQGNVTKFFQNSATQYTVGIALKPTLQHGCNIIVFQDGGHVQGRLATNAAGGIEYHTYPGGQDTIIASSPPGLITLAGFQYIEVSVVFSTTATGSVAAQFNGESIFSVLNVVTSSSGNSQANAVQVIYDCGDVSNQLVDDLYVCDGTGTINNSFLGDVGVQCLFPSAGGQVDNFTPNPSTDHNWQCVSENPPDDDSTYVSSSVAGTIDLYKITQLPSGSEQVVAVQIVACGRKDDTNTRVLGIGFGDGSSHVFDTGWALGTSYQMYTQPYDQDPITNSAWTVSSVNSGQIGVKVLS